MTYVDLNLDAYVMGIAPPRLVTWSFRSRLTIAHIQNVVASYYDIPLIDMVSSRRSREVARPRQIAMYLARHLTPQSLPDIGRRFGGKDHTTVIHAVKTIAKLMLLDKEMESDVHVLRERLAV